MGTAIDQTRFDDNDFRKFQKRLQHNLKAFRTLLDKPGFGLGSPSFGAELELYIVDEQQQPLSVNQLIYQQAKNSQLALELNQYNLEYNFTPVSGSQPLTNLQQEMEQSLAQLDKLAQAHGGRVMPIGILPTLKTRHFGLSAITDLPRYHVLAEALRNKRGSDFHVSIDGPEPLDFLWSDVTLEGANTSFQFHLRCNPSEFVDTFNTAQLITPLVTAMAANSPIFLGNRLWHETRIALFKQAIDCRDDDPLAPRAPSRVLFGHGWLRDSIYELFSEGVYLFDSLLPVCSDTDYLAQVKAGEIPALEELRLHMGSIWYWNRPIYDPGDGGHVRLELRSLPAGPTPVDMLANAALMIGLTAGLRETVKERLPGIPFRYAEHNFYNAAKFGLNATLYWPDPLGTKLKQRPVPEILNELLPIAEQGLQQLGCNEGEIQRYLNVCRGTLDSRQNGAQWQLDHYANLRQQTDKETALQRLVADYRTKSESGIPVHQWLH